MSTLPLTLNDATSISDLEVPCALRRHVRIGANRKILEHLSDYGCQWSFFDWVENYRFFDPNIEEDELRMCPLIWCRKIFDSKELAARHVFDCPRLSNAWYWCPSHRRPERYLECNKGCEIVSRSRFRNKDYKLHLADKFLNWICRRRSEKGTEAKFRERTTLDEDKRLEYKEELSTGLDIQEFGYPESDPESSRANEDQIRTRWINEKARYQGDGPDMAEILGDDVPELASHQSVMSDSSLPTEMPTSESSRRSLWQRRRGISANDSRCSIAKKPSNDYPSTDESGSTSSSISLEASGTDDFCRVPTLGARSTTIGNSTLHRQSDGNRYEIFVSTDMSREVSDSFGKLAKSSCVETRISSSPKHKSLDLNRPLPSSPQRNSLNLPPPWPSIPNLNKTHMSPIRKPSSNHSSVVNRVHGLSNRASVSYSDSETLECMPTESSPDMYGTPHDTSLDPQSRRESTIMRSSSTDIEMGDGSLPGNTSSEDPTRSEDLRNHCPIWSSVSSSILTPTADYPDSNIVSPSSPNSGFSSPLSSMFSPISPIADCVSQPSRFVFPVTLARDGPDLGTAKHHEDVASGWSFPSPSPPESKPKELNHTRCAFDTSEPRFPVQRPVSDGMVFLASRVQWTKDSMPQQHFHRCHHRFQSEGWSAPSVSTRLRQSILKSSNMESSTYSSAIDESSESDGPSSMIKSIVTPDDTPNSRSLVLIPSVSSSAAPALDIHMDSNFIDGNIGTLRTEMLMQMPMPHFRPIDIDANDHPFHELPSPVGGEDQPTHLNSPYSSGRWSSIASWNGRQMDVPPLFSFRNDISSHDYESEEANPNSRTSRATLTNITSNRALSQSQGREGHESGGEVASSESDDTSAHQCRPILPSPLQSPYAAKMPPHCFDHGSLLVTHSPSKEIQVETLQALVGAVNNDWMKRLKSVPELWQRCRPLSARILLEKGIRTLREYFRGKVTQTFEDVFAFIHLAFATAFPLHCQQNLDGFYDDALQWQHTLPNTEDKVMFLKAMGRWSWLPELQLNPLLNSSRHTSFGTNTLRESFNYSDQTDLLDILSNSEVFKACKGFLDDFKESDISERNDRYPAEALALFAQSRIDIVEHLIKHITGPLQQERGVEALRRIMIDTELRIATGLLQNTREVEVTLITSGRRSSESLEVFERYRDLVISQCDKAVQSSGSDRYLTWRNEHYIVDLNRLLETPKQEDRYDLIEFSPKLSPDTRGFEAISPNQLVLDSPAPWSSISNGARTPDSSPTSDMSWTFTGSSMRPEVNTRGTSLTALSQASISPTSLAPDTPTSSVVSCRACSREFKGNPQDARSNLQRHLRNSRRHKTSAGLKCPQLECRIRPAMRSDNLGPHLQNFHKMSSPSKRKSIIDESKLSARRART